MLLNLSSAHLCTYYPPSAVRAFVGQYARQAAAGAGAALCAGSLLLAPPALSDENSGTTVIRLPASEDPTIFVAQQVIHIIQKNVGSQPGRFAYTSANPTAWCNPTETVIDVGAWSMPRLAPLGPYRVTPPADSCSPL